MIGRRHLIMTGVAALTAGCAGGRVSTRGYRGPQVTHIVVSKSRRRMWLLHRDKVLRRYPISLGFAPEGDKKVEGDGKTPEGRYVIDRRNADSQFHLSLGISYPNAQDIEEAKALGQPPGGDIFIHGESPKPQDRRDWTFGCIAVRNRDIEEIYAMVPNGAVIDILP